MVVREGCRRVGICFCEIWTKCLHAFASIYLIHPIPPVSLLLKTRVIYVTLIGMIIVLLNKMLGKSSVTVRRGCSRVSCRYHKKRSNFFRPIDQILHGLSSHKVRAVRGRAELSRLRHPRRMSLMLRCQRTSKSCWQQGLRCDIY